MRCAAFLRGLGWALFLFAWSGCAADSSVAAERVGHAQTPHTAPEKTHWLLVLHQTPAGWAVDDRVFVHAALPRRRNPARRERPLVVEVVDSAGQTLYRDSLADPSWVTGESIDPQSGETTHHRVRPPQGAAMTVRVPVLPEAHTLVMTLHGTALQMAGRQILLDAGEVGVDGP